MLLIASALAAQMSLHRTAGPLAARIRPPGWRISFEAPTAWIRDDGPRQPVPAIIAFYGATRAGRPATLALWRIDQSTGSDLGTICVLIMRQHGASVQPSEGLSGIVSPATKFGSVEGYERADAARTTVVRAAVLSPGETYAVSLSVENAVIDEHVYRLFDLACRSIQLEEG